MAEKTLQISQTWIWFSHNKVSHVKLTNNSSIFHTTVYTNQFKDQMAFIKLTCQFQEINLDHARFPNCQIVSVKKSVDQKLSFKNYFHLKLFIICVEKLKIFPTNLLFKWQLSICQSASYEAETWSTVCFNLSRRKLCMKYF